MRVKPNDPIWKAAAELRGEAFLPQLLHEMAPVLADVIYLEAPLAGKVGGIWDAFEQHLAAMGYQVKRRSPHPFKTPILRALEMGIEEHFEQYLKEELADLVLVPVPGRSTAIQDWAQDTANSLEHEIKKTAGLANVAVTFEVTNSVVVFTAKIPDQPDRWWGSIELFFRGLVDAFVAKARVKKPHAYGIDYQAGAFLAEVDF